MLSARVRRPGLEQADLDVRVLAQAGGQHAAGRAGADDDVVELRHSRSPCWSRRSRARRRRAARASTFLSNLPTLVFGISSMKANSSGSHHLATRGREVLAQLLRRRALAVLAARRTRAAARSSARRASRSPRPRRTAGCAISSVLELDRGDPLAAGLDHVLGAVGDPDEAVARRSSAMSPVRSQPSSELVVAATGPRSSARAIHGPRTSISPVDSPSHGRPRRRRPSGAARPSGTMRPAVRARVPVLVARVLDAGGRARDGADRARLRHPPGLEDAHAVALLEALASAAAARRRRRRPPLVS